MLFLYLLTSTHGTIAGVFRLPDGYASEDLGWKPERVSKGFAELFRNGLANRCETTKWAWVIDHLAWNPLDNPNQRKAAAKCALQIPDQCSWKQVFARACGESLGLQAAPNDEPIGNGSETLSEPVTGTGAGTVAIAGTVEETSSTAKLPTCPVKDVIKLFVKAVPELPKPRPEFWAKSKSADAMRDRWKWVLTESKESGERYATTSADALAWFERFFARVAESDFLTGRNGAWRGCDLGWLMRPDNFRKVVEGNYLEKRAA